jgi:hypothetical protein
MKYVHVDRYQRRRQVRRVVNEEGREGYSGLPPEAKRITMKDAKPIMAELEKIEGRGAFVRANVVGSVVNRGWSDHDLDIAVAIDPSKVGVEVGDLDEFYEWLNSEEEDAVHLVLDIHRALERADGHFLPGSETDPESWVFVRGNRSIPTDVWWTWTDRENEVGNVRELAHISRMIYRTREQTKAEMEGKYDLPRSVTDRVVDEEFDRPEGHTMRDFDE